jgi:shikimate kinase
MISDIILIGPIGTGKSTLGKLLSVALKIPQVSMDDERLEYYNEIGFDLDLGKRIKTEEGFFKLYKYWKPFEAYAVERMLADHKNCVIDLGAGHSVFEDDALFARVERAFRPYRNVVLILPSPDLDESVRILKARGRENEHNGFDFVEHFVKHHSNHNLAKIVVYTKDKTPEQTRDEIIRATS